MKLEYLWLDEFKNLRDFKVFFAASHSKDEQTDCKRRPLTPEEDRFRVVLGQNGSGKSNLLEALVIIFRDLDLGDATEFAYELRYTMKGGNILVEVKNSPNAEKATERFSFVVRRGRKEPLFFGRKRVADATRDFRPNHVFSYYSGPSNRLECHFWPHQKKYSEALRKERDLPLRPFFYAMPIHSQFVLLAFFSSEDSKGREFLKKYFGILAMESVLFVMKQPYWKSKEGDPRFWNARWVVQRFLDKLFTASLAPLRRSGHIQTNWEKAETPEFLYMFLQNQKALMNLRGLAESDSDFFKELESTFMSDLIHETRIRVRVLGMDGSLTFRELSEGEQQLLTVVGLLRFTKESESLFLLDEPDTHLNPKWGMEYLQMLRDVADTGNHSQVLLATHDPLVLSALRREQVIVLDLSKESRQIEITYPELDPAGLGISGILRNYFLLRSTIDLPTQAKLDKRFKLLGKGTKRTKVEEQRLHKLSAELADAGFASEHRDANFELFAQAMGQARGELRLSMTRKESERVRARALKIARKIVAKEVGG
jgi:predicted ATPase